jgi:hypothetical protein
MDNRLFPGTIDNQYRGQKLALWFFWVVVIMRGLQGLSLIVGGPSIVRDADGIPLETFPIAASQSIVAVFVISGLSRLVLSLLCVLVFVRYRSAIALMFAVLALDQLGKELLLHFYPLFRVGNPIGPTVNLCLLFLTLCGLVLSIWGNRNSMEKS